MKILRYLLIAAASLLVLVLALAAALWVYSGSEGSLASSLRWLSPRLPAGQHLEFDDVRGSVRQGGRIGALRWSRDGLQVRAHDVTMRWQCDALLRRELHLTELTVGQLQIDDQRPPTSDAAPAPPTQLKLPLKVDAQVRIDVLEWTRSTTQRIDQVTFHYVFDSYSHSIEKGQGQFSSNEYSYSGSLQASAPLALTVQVNGHVSAPVPGGAVLTLAADASLKGELAGRDAQLLLQAELAPQARGATPAARLARAGTPMQASLSAQLAPWQQQPVRSAQAHWQALDLSALWAQAPHTRLDGHALVTPQDAQWHATVQLNNAASGPWNQQRLPIDSLHAELRYSAGGWLLRSMQAHAAGGSVSATGQLSNPATWQMRGALKAIDPAAIDTRLDSTPLDGTLSAQQSLTAANAGNTLASAAHLGAIAFEVALQASPKTSGKARSALQTLQLRRLEAKGVWSNPTLTLDALTIVAQDAQLHGPLQLHTISRDVQGAVSLQFPGLLASAQGRLSRTDGQGQLTLQVQDAKQATQWLSRWPYIARYLDQKRWFGQADLIAQWRGGWQDQASALQLDGQLRSDQFGWSERDEVPNPVTLRDVQLDLSGSPTHLLVTSRGQISAGGHALDWQSRLDGVRLATGAWQASVNALQLALHQGDKASGVWRLALATPAARAPQLTWQPGGGAGQWTLSGGSAQLQGPVAGRAQVHWQDVNWSPSGWQSQGRIEGLPLAWIDASARRSLSELGLRTDMLLAGQWQIIQGRSLQASLTLERSAGDLFLQSGDNAQTTIAAAMQEAWLQANLNDGQLSASLRWDSARAGKALLAFSTQVQSASGDWSWNDKVPVAGSVQLQLPPMDVWSALAPPGWRLRGTVNTHIDLSGTLDRPVWNGTLQARDLALRSAVDGIDFSQGQLDATLHDQQLDLTSFTVRGAGSGSGKADGGQLRLSGNVVWHPAASAATLREQIQMTLHAELQALRLSTHPDRRLVTSGKLNASYQGAAFALRGALAADHALVTLPDDSAPTLGDDVVVRQHLPRDNAATPAATRARWPIDVAVDLDLGPDFQVRGRGMQTRLAGKLTVTANTVQSPALTGNVRSVQGSYRAYGQMLDIERGVLRFTGAVDNPALDILAIRPNLSQRVGVQISGTALSPVVSLYAEPDLPDAEKLAWLVLGRSASGGGAEAAMVQQAAMALLGGNGKSLSESVSTALGLDELSIRGGAESATGNSTVSAASVTLGKRLSRDFYVAYERSLNSTAGVFSIFFDLSKRLTLRAQTGEQSTVDLIYTMRYD